MALLKLNGIDFSGNLTPEGYSFERFDIDDENSGRTMDAIMHRAVISRKTQLKIDFAPLTTEKFHQLTNILENTFVSVEYFSIKANAVVTETFFNSKRGGNALRLKRARYNDFTGLWTVGSINLTQR